jgi:hypothetical protein
MDYNKDPLEEDLFGEEDEESTDELGEEGSEDLLEDDVSIQG